MTNFFKEKVFNMLTRIYYEGKLDNFWIELKNLYPDLKITEEMANEKYCDTYIKLKSAELEKEISEPNINDMPRIMKWTGRGASSDYILSLFENVLCYPLYDKMSKDIEDIIYFGEDDDRLKDVAFSKTVTLYPNPYLDTCVEITKLQIDGDLKFYSWCLTLTNVYVYDDIKDKEIKMGKYTLQEGDYIIMNPRKCIIIVHNEGQLKKLGYSID